MIHMDSIEVLAFDVSFRATGFAKLNINFAEKRTTLVDCGCITCPPFQTGFDGLNESSVHMSHAISMMESLIQKNAGVTIVEMPAFSQSAKSAMAIGMCWGFISQIDGILIEPHQLKYWSESKKGDKKNKVKEKVLERISLGSYASNDNIVDAVGIGMMFGDLVSTEKYNDKDRLKIN